MVAVLNRKGVCPGGLDSIPTAAYEDVVVAIRDLKPLEKAPEKAAEAPSAPAAAETPAAPPAATEPPTSGESAHPDGVDENGMPDDDHMGIENEAAKGPETFGPAAAARQLQRLGIICKHLEDNGIPWKLIAESAVKHPFVSRKELTFEEAQTAIKTLRSIEKTLPEQAKAS